MRSLLVALAVATTLRTSAAQDVPLRVDLPTRTVSLTRPELARLAADTVRWSAHDATPKLYSALPLTAVLRAAGLPIDSLRIGRAAWIVLAIADDGYVVAFSAGELDPKLGGARVFLAIAADGASTLPREEGPYRLLVPADGRAARSAHRVVALKVVDALAR